MSEHRICVIGGSEAQRRDVAMNVAEERGVPYYPLDLLRDALPDGYAADRQNWVTQPPDDHKLDKLCEKPLITSYTTELHVLPVERGGRGLLEAIMHGRRTRAQIRQFERNSMRRFDAGDYTMRQVVRLPKRSLD